MIRKRQCLFLLIHSSPRSPANTTSIIGAVEISTASARVPLVTCAASAPRIGRTLQLYCEQLEKGKRAIESREEFPPLKERETAAFGLRMNAGWPFEEFQRVTGLDLRQVVR